MTVTLLQQRNPTALNVLDYAVGLLPNGSNDFTTIIQAALNAANTAGGGEVIVPFSGNGNYVISAPLVIYSNTKLTLARGVTITLAANSNCNMIKNAAVTAQRSVSDAAITTGTTTLTSATANFTSADVGRSVGVAGALGNGYILIATITAFTNSTTVTLGVAAQATVSAANCSIYNRDTNIEISGGYWQRGANGYLGGTTSGVQYQTTLFRHLDNFSFHDMTFASTQKAYHLSVADCTNGVMRNITINTPNTVANTDGINVHGPAQWLSIENVYGTNGDDFVSLHTADGDGNLQDSVGNISDMVITNLFPNNCAQAAFKAHGATGMTLRSITVKGIHGTTQRGALHLFDSNTPSQNDIDGMWIEDVDLIATNNNQQIALIYTSNNKGTITLKNIVYRQTSQSNQQILAVQSQCILGNLIVEGVIVEGTQSPITLFVAGTVNSILLRDVKHPNTSDSLNAHVQISSSGVVGTLAVRDVMDYRTTNSQNTVLSNLGSLKVAIFDNIYLNNGGIVMLQKNTILNTLVLMNNITLDSAYQLAQIQNGGTADFVLSNLTVMTTNQSALFALTGVGSNMSVRGRGVINPNSKTCFSRDGTQAPRINHPEMLADLSQLTPGDQDMVTNNNGALSCGAGLCIFHTGGTGNGWKNVYSGSTY